MGIRASGGFDVVIGEQLPSDAAEGVVLGRATLSKQFTGDLAGTSKGEMLSAMTSVKGSAGYVAIERVVGALHGRLGSFVLQHSGAMVRGASSLRVSVVPDSGTGELKYLAGTMTIEIVDRKHFYTFDYTLEEGA